MLARWLVAAALSLVPVALGATSPASAADPASRIVPPDEQPVKEIPFFVFADTQISYRYQFPASNPGSQVRQADGSFRNQDGPKHILNIAHADAWAYGSNFFALDILKSGSQFPAGTTNAPGGFAAYDYGNTEAYGLYRGTLSLNALTGTTAFAIPGLVKDVSLSYGFDANAQNSPFGPKKRDIVGGLNVAFDVPAGFMNLSVHAYKEWNRNGFNIGPDRSVSFDAVPEFELVYSFPLTFTGLPLRIAGFNNIVLPKGRGVTNPAAFAFNPKTGLEFLSRTSLVLDIGKLLYDQPNRVDLFVGFQYWHNKFGNIERVDFKGTEEKSFIGGVSFHVF